MILFFSSLLHQSVVRDNAIFVETESMVKGAANTNNFKIAKN